jgi:hypothetical protein
MDDFLLDCRFNAVYKGLKFGELTPRYDIPRAMPHSAEPSLQKIHPQLNVKFK